MANFYQQWAPQPWPINTAYQPVHDPNAQHLQSDGLQDAAPPVYNQHATAYDHIGKPTEHLIQESAHPDLPSRPKQTKRHMNFGGLKVALRSFLAVAVIVLIINFSWLAYASSHYGGLKSGYGSIQRGDCGAAKRTNTWLHLLINVLSTLLLTGSNAFMSAYCCPSRKEVDTAHARRKWLHVGMLSFRNLGGIAKRKALIVVLLSLTSVPFHLLYNSLVFVSLSTNNYYYSVVDEAFLSGANYSLTGPISYAGGDDRQTFVTIPNLPDGSLDSSMVWLPREQNKLNTLYTYFDAMQKNASSWERLSNRECIQAYSNVFLGGRRNLILVSSQKNNTDSLLTYDGVVFEGGGMEENWWICSMHLNDGGNQICQPDTYLSKADDWEVFGFPVEYCLSERVDDVCEVIFSLPIMAVVIVFKVLKVIAMTWVFWRYNAEQILTTVGDAVASFLLREDPTTRGMCLADRMNIDRFLKMPGTGVPYSDRRRRWARAVSKRKWVFFMLLMAISFGLIFFFGVWGFSHIKKRGASLSPSGLWSLGFGGAHQDAIAIYDALPEKTGPITVAVIANIPQIFLAAVWLLYLGIMTSMFLAQDWSRFGIKAQVLQVSSPAGQQRGSWLLGAPPIHGVSMLILQILLHWLVSQSIFVISMKIYTPDGSIPTYTPKEFVNCGYSPIAIVFSVIASGVLMLSALAMAVRRFPKGSPPLVSTNSAAISAACHMPEGSQSKELVYEPLRWGQTGHVVHGVAHCSLMPARAFDEGRGSAPVVGWHYA